MRIFRKIPYFCLGGGLYTCLELLWRGRSHVSMFLLGGGCFLMLGQLRKCKLPLPARVILGAAGVTILELATGLIVNRDFSVWDYRHLPFHYRGQISLIFSLLWMPVSLAGMELYRLADKTIP